MKFKNYLPLGVCILMTIFSVIVGLLYPPVLNFYVFYAAMWGVFSGVAIATIINKDDNDKTKF